MLDLSVKELNRILEMSKYEAELRKIGHKYIAGVDEAGRGPLAGPVVAAACILPEKFLLKGLNDSKKVTPQKRKDLFSKLINNKNVIYSIGIVESPIIDEINILQATLQAMQKAVFALAIKPDILLVDGNQLPTTSIPSKALIKGDSISISIAAASIIAKETRDAIMEKLHEKWPQYGFKEHKGYGTEKHLEAIKKYGPCLDHRKSFMNLKNFSFQEEANSLDNS